MQKKEKKKERRPKSIPCGDRVDVINDLVLCEGSDHCRVVFPDLKDAVYHAICACPGGQNVGDQARASVKETY